MKKNSHPSLDTDRIVEDILSGMSLKEKSLIANMDEKSLPYLQYAFDVYISRDVGNDPDAGREIMKRVWQKLQATHRIRLVKEGRKP
ncbi:MAG: hypothetical protein HGJ94_01215 [Desulfosarcina sp.]|nr:hypothetical protein [Desulfosarcina sp.]MBC2741907.1 hypothetical protein [Desulfosarcina sp.]MBC2764820.1 hypothetical protein [Desulfosarcina sp.]